MGTPAFISNLASMRYSIGQFRAWRCHHDDGFRERFDTLKQWQIATLKIRHRQLLDDPRCHAAAIFLLTKMYGADNLEELAGEVEKALPLASRIVPDSVLGTAAIALELNTLTGMLDQLTAEVLFEDMGVTDITLEAYCKAYAAAAPREQRQRQMQLIAELGMGLDRYVRSTLVYGAFKLARGPAHLSGLSQLYGLLEEGFQVMRPMEAVGDFIRAFVTTEETVIDNIWTGKADPLLLGHP